MAHQQAVKLLALLVGQVEGDAAPGGLADGGALLGGPPALVQGPDTVLPAGTPAGAATQQGKVIWKKKESKTLYRT